MKKQMITAAVTLVLSVMSVCPVFAAANMAGLAEAEVETAELAEIEVETAELAESEMETAELAEIERESVELVEGLEEAGIEVETEMAETENAETEVETESSEIRGALVYSVETTLQNKKSENTEEYESRHLEGFVEQNGSTYYYVNGVPVTGFQTINGKTYYFNPKTGAMQTGYLHLGDYYYYFNTETGVMLTGWQMIPYATSAGTKKVYFNAAGQMQFGWQVIGGKKYYFDTTSGKLQTGWKTIGGKKYYFNKTTGVMQTGYLHLGSYYYYLNTSTGAMLTGWQVIPYATSSGTKKVYFNASGQMQFGWQVIGGKKYYFDTASGKLQTGWKMISGKKYYFSASTGAMQTGCLHLGNYYYYLSTQTGEMLTGWQTIPCTTVKGTKKVYLGGDGRMVFGRKKIGEMWYKFDAKSGALITKGSVSIAMVDSAGEYGRIKNALEKAGATVTVFTTSSFDVSKYDGLVLPGGADVTPSLYGEDYNGARGCNYSLDTLQMAAIKKFVKAGKPVLGICRGCQILNVSLGGTLYQDISGHKGVYTSTTISGGLMKYMYGTARTGCRCTHHQCPKTLAAGLKVTQKSADGHIEAYEHTSKPIYGIQWHPENSGSMGEKVFSTFVNVCRAWK